jgi:predicted MFS family arabinose efflux permease
MADRWRQPPVMWLAVVLSTAGFVTVALTAQRPAVAVAAAAAAGLGAPPFEACLRVLWSHLVADQLRHAAYTLDVTAQELIFIVGPVAALAAAHLAGPAGGLAAIAAIQVGGTLVFTSTPVTRRWRGTLAPRHWAGPLRSTRMWTLLVTTLLVGAGVGSTVVAITGYSEAAGSRSWAGWLLAAQAAGALAGGLLMARRPPDDPYRRLPRAALILGLGYLPMLLTSPLPVMAVWVTISGLALPAVLTSVFVVADRVAPPGTAAESFAWVATAFLIGSAAGSAVDGVLLDATGVLSAGFAPAPVAILTAAGLLWLLRRPQPAVPTR